MLEGCVFLVWLWWLCIAFDVREFRDIQCHRMEWGGGVKWPLNEQMNSLATISFTGIATILPTMDIGLMHWWCLVGPRDGCVVRIRVCFCTLQCHPMALDVFSLEVGSLKIMIFSKALIPAEDLLKHLDGMICLSTSWHVMSSNGPEYS